LTLSEALLEATSRLERGRVSNPRLCAEVLLAHFIRQDRTFLYAHGECEIGGEEYQSLKSAIYERLSGVPVQYIIGHQEFYGRDFVVNPSVLIPRPETEFIVESVLENTSASDARIIDVGTGSGCIAVTLALELPNAEVFASDISEDALRIARLNASQFNARLRFVCADLLDGIEGEFDWIVSNPPYVHPNQRDYLQREVRDHEPHVALFSPGHGVEIYRRLVDQASPRLKSGGWLIMEIGFGMEDSVRALFKEEGWQICPTKTDLQGIPRTVIARRR